MKSSTPDSLLRLARKAAGLTLEEAADRTDEIAASLREETGDKRFKGITRGYLTLLENNQRTPSVRVVKVLSKSYGLPESYLLTNPETVPVSGEINTPDTISERVGEVAFVPPPAGFPARDVACAVVRGDAMEPRAPDGWLIFYKRPVPGEIQADAINSWSVCGLADGSVVIKKITPSKGVPGRYDLESFRPGKLTEWEVMWASRIVNLSAPDLGKSS